MIYWGKMEIYTSNLLKDEYVGLNEVADGVSHIFFVPAFLGRVEQNKQAASKRGYYSIKV